MNKKINIGYILTYFFYYGLTAIFYGFGVYTLTNREFSSGQAGIILAIANIIGFLLQPFLSNISDNSKKYDPFLLSILSSCLIILFSILNILVNNGGLLLAIIFICAMSLYICIEPLLNGFSSKFEKSKIKVNFAFTRAAGSLSYSIMCFVLGKLTIIYSYPSVNTLMLVISLLLFVSLFILRKHYNKVKIDNDVLSKKESVSYIDFIKHNKIFMQMIFFLMLIFLAFSSFDNYMLLVVEPLGGSSDDMGTILSFKAIIEVLGMVIIFPYLQKKLEIKQILKLAVIFYTIKIAMQTFAPSLFWIYAAQVLTCLSFSLLIPGMVTYINKYMDEKEVIRSQALFTMSVSLGNIFASFLAGIITEDLGVKNMEYIALAVCVIGLIGFVVYLNKVSSHAE